MRANIQIAGTLRPAAAHRQAGVTRPRGLVCGTTFLGRTLHPATAPLPALRPIVARLAAGGFH